ncbi:MAG: hypothetical protein IPO86_00300 [Saprospiraceae bacterium]|nr:hypothetical protein [Saprospiraceae bacterium]
MVISQKTLEKLRDIINEESEYRSGPKLVKFFNNLGFRDLYGQGFPSRWKYTDDSLTKINGTPELDKAIKNVFAVQNFIGKTSELDKLIESFNQYLAFDKWKVARKETEITFERVDKVILKTEVKVELGENEFLNQEFDNISIDDIGLDIMISDIIKLRIKEIKECLKAEVPLSIIFLCGSTLEGILLGVALKHPAEFNRSSSSPKALDGKPKPFHSWTLSNFIDVSCDVGILKLDVKKFSQSLRDFRNYIHPYEQLSSQFNPDIHTAKISWQVLKAALYQLINYKIN